MIAFARAGSGHMRAGACVSPARRSAPSRTKEEGVYVSGWCVAGAIVWLVLRVSDAWR